MQKHPGQFDKQFAVEQDSGTDGEDDGATLSTQDQVDAAVADFIEHRSAIEQTKGMLMLVYGINETAAFKVLQWRSQEVNVKLRFLAEQIATEFFGLGRHAPRTAYDNVILTAHLRVDADGPSRNGNEVSP